MTDSKPSLGTQAQTWEEAEQLAPFSIHGYADWPRLARLVNGYELARQKDQQLKQWGRQQHLNWRDSKRWNLSLIELLMMLFYFWRQQHMTGGTSWGEEIDTILHEIARLTNQEYVTDYNAIKQEERERQREVNKFYRTSY